MPASSQCSSHVTASSLLTAPGAKEIAKVVSEMSPRGQPMDLRVAGPPRPAAKRRLAPDPAPAGQGCETPTSPSTTADDAATAVPRELVRRPRIRWLLPRTIRVVLMINVCGSAGP